MPIKKSRCLCVLLNYSICFVPVILILPMFWGINGILYVQPIADVLSAIITIFMALHLHQELDVTKQKFLSEKAG